MTDYRCTCTPDASPCPHCDGPDRDRPCQACYWWKRRSAEMGTCWQPDKLPHAPIVNEADTCDQHRPKVTR